MTANDCAPINKIGAVAGLKNIWPRIVGEKIAAISFPYRINANTLHVAVRNSIWLTELPYLKPDMLAKITPLLQDVTDIKFTLDRTPAAKKPLPVPSRELTEEDLEWIENLTALISNDAQKKAFRAVLTAYREFKNL